MIPREGKENSRITEQESEPGLGHCSAPGCRAAFGQKGWIWKGSWNACGCVLAGNCEHKGRTLVYLLTKIFAFLMDLSLMCSRK